MKRRLFQLILVAIPFSANCQKNAGFKGINFQKNSSLEQIKGQAKREQKFIFIDCYATWCGPCKYMDKNIFSDDSVAQIFNQYFVNLKIQIDSSNSDNEAIKNFYGEASYFRKNFNIQSYPTYLFFDSDFHLVSKSIGAVKRPSEFYSIAEDVLDSSKQYFTLIAKYEKGNRDKSLIQNLMKDAVLAKDQETAIRIGDDYITSIGDPYTKSELNVIKNIVKSSNSKGFELFAKNSKKIDSILGGKYLAESIIVEVLYSELERKYLRDKNRVVKWEKIISDMRSIDVYQVNEVILKLKMQYAVTRELWNDFGRYACSFYDNYYSTLVHNDTFIMNNILWLIFLKCESKDVLKRAALWSKRSINMVNGQQDPAALDTYANLLYKIGQTKESLKWEKKAVSLAITDGDADERNEINSNFKKMKSGAPTWHNK